MKPHEGQRGFVVNSASHQAVRLCLAGLLGAALAPLSLSQAAGSNPPHPPAPAQAGTPANPSDKEAKSEKLPRGTDRRRAAALFLEASKLFEKEQFEQALDKYRQAADLDPSNRNYALAAEVARSHAVTALTQSAAKDRMRSNTAAERAALVHALALDPSNLQVTEHLQELGDNSLREQNAPLYEQGADAIGEPLQLAITPGLHSFHIHSDKRSVLTEVLKAYGLDPFFDDSVRHTQVRLDVDNVNFEQAARIVELVTNSFYVPLDAHRVLLASDTTENRRQFERLDVETIYLPGLAAAELTEVGTLAKNVFEIQQSIVEPSAGTITVRGPASTLNAFNATIRDLIDGHSQVLLEVNLIEVAHTGERNTGIHPPQSITAFNVYAEEQSILNSNQALVQQIISSGLAAPGDTLAILGILLASGQISSSLFSNGIALFGGGLTASALSPGSMSANLNLNSSDSRELERMQLRLSDGQPGMVRSGTRYPIQTSSVSGLSGGLPNIPGLTGAGSSSSLSSLLGSLGSSVPNVPQIEYQDLGLTLKATPSVMRNNDVALNIDMKIDALAGSSVNGNPILDNRTYSGIVTLKQGEGVVVVSTLSKQQSRAISGVPGLSEIPGFNDITGNDKQSNYSTLIIVIAPHVVRGTQAGGHTPMMRVERTATGR